MTRLDQPLRSWFAELHHPDGRTELRGPFVAHPGRATERMHRLFPTYAAANRLVLVRDPEEQARERREVRS